MPEYEIMRWDSVIPKGNTFPYPMVSFKPEIGFEEYVTKNKGLFLVRFSGTESTYDEKPVAGMVYNAGVFPNYRPNFFNKTGYYVLVIFTNWIGYPKNNGNVILQGSDELGDVKPEFQVPTPIEFYNEDKKDARLSTNQIYYILLAIFILFCFLLMLPSKSLNVSVSVCRIGEN